MEACSRGWGMQGPGRGWQVSWVLGRIFSHLGSKPGWSSSCSKLPVWLGEGSGGPWGIPGFRREPVIWKGTESS